MKLQKSKMMERIKEIKKKKKKRKKKKKENLTKMCLVSSEILYVVCIAHQLHSYSAGRKRFFHPRGTSITQGESHWCHWKSHKIFHHVFPTIPYYLQPKHRRENPFPCIFSAFHYPPNARDASKSRGGAREHRAVLWKLSPLVSG